MQKIVYLFGAGATHAELANLERGPSVKFEDTRGLLISHVSRRVIEKARKYLRDIEMVSATTGSLNIELYISLIETSRISKWETKTFHLKRLVKEDIEGILKEGTVRRFHLHKALLELHEQEQMKEREKLTGLISLNYDNVLDDAYKVVHAKSPEYSFSMGASKYDGVAPLLKLHGSFNWNPIDISGRKRRLEIIPLGANKNYLHFPYNFIWGRALELLTQCDILRVIGCSMSQNDIHLVDLLFKAHLEKGQAFQIQVIDYATMGETIRNNYGFLPEIKTLSEIESSFIPDLKTQNPFKTWLKYKGITTLGNAAHNTKYLSKVVA